MLTDELLRLVASQPEARETRRVKIWGPSLRAAVAARAMTMDEIDRHPDQSSGIRTFRYGHLVGRPRTSSEILDWQARFPRHHLPDDLVELLLRVDGVHLWADLDEERAYFGIAPLDEWRDAAASDGPELFDEPPVGMLVISYHQNSDYSAVLDTVTSVYRWFDHEDISHPFVIGSSVPELIDWLWKQSAELRPELGS